MNQTVPCPKEATCPRCRDLQQRRVQAVARYAAQALCTFCGAFAADVRRRAR